MAWQAYVDSSLIGTGHIKRAVICGHDGTIWSQSAGFAPTSSELKALTKGFSDNGGIQSSGITLAGVNYATLRADSRSIYGKKDVGGVIVIKTGQAVVMGIYEAGTRPEQATAVVVKLTDYLIENGY